MQNPLARLMAAKDEIDTENAERVQKRVLREHNEVLKQRQQQEQEGLKKAQQVCVWSAIAHNGD